MVMVKVHPGDSHLLAATSIRGISTEVMLARSQRHLLTCLISDPDHFQDHVNNSNENTYEWQQERVINGLLTLTYFWIGRQR